MLRDFLDRSIGPVKCHLTRLSLLAGGFDFFRGMGARGSWENRNDSRKEAWTKLTQVFDTQSDLTRRLALYPAERDVPEHAAEYGLQVCCHGPSRVRPRCVSHVGRPTWEIHRGIAGIPPVLRPGTGVRGQWATAGAESLGAVLSSSSFVTKIYTLTKRHSPPQGFSPRVIPSSSLRYLCSLLVSIAASVVFSVISWVLTSHWFTWASRSAAPRQDHAGVRT